MNGFDVLSLATDTGQLVARHAFIVLTANKAAADAPEAVDAYFATLLERYHIPVMGKPCDVDELLACVAEADRYAAESAAGLTWIGVVRDGPPGVELLSDGVVQPARGFQHRL
jgi:hypothetical protein